MDSAAQLARLGAKEYDAQLRAAVRGYKHVSPQQVREQTLVGVLGNADEPAGTDLEYLFRLRDCLAAMPEGARLKFDGPMWIKRVQYLETFDSVSVRYAGTAFRELVEGVYGDAAMAGRPHMAIRPLRNVLLRLDLTGETFTSFHLPFLRACLESALYAEALPILERSTYAFPSTSSTVLHGQYLCSSEREGSTYITPATDLTSTIHYRHVQEYHLLAGIIYLALGKERWRDAKFAFEMVLTSPTQNVATGFMLEAYRKWILLCLLLDGQVRDSVSGLSPGALRVLQTAAKPYNALRSVFEQSDLARLKAEVDVGLKLWDEDGNLGLALQLTSAHQRHAVLALQKHYTSYPLSRIDSNIDRAMELLTLLISAGDLHATIDTSTSAEPVVRFLAGTASAAAPSEAELQAQLLQQIQRNQRLVDAVKAADAKIVLSHEFVQVARKTRDQADAYTPGDRMALDTGYGSGGAGSSAVAVAGLAGGDDAALLPGAWVGEVADEDLMET